MFTSVTSYFFSEPLDSISDTKHHYFFTKSLQFPQKILFFRINVGMLFLEIMQMCMAPRSPFSLYSEFSLLLNSYCAYQDLL